METIKDIVKGTFAKLTHICNSKAYFIIDTELHQYQLEIDCSDKEWENTYIYPEYKTITLMRWIKRGIDKEDDTFIMLK